MSEGWAGGSSRAWRKLRKARLDHDGHLCQLQYDGCLTIADQVHHLDGVRRGKLAPFDRLLSSCWKCNNAAGDPTRTDPPPTPTSTQW